ncbi:HAD-like domain-containing protein [Sporodiniella umbellata]|nr:HAD-like domain-containing protein [Sporodiniella umbellata]
MIQAVIFDLGGVCVGSPMAGIHAYEKKHGLPRNYINVAIVAQGEQGAFQRLERGELQLDGFYQAFGDQLSDKKCKAHYARYLAQNKKPMAWIPDVVVDGKELFKTMMAESARVDPVVLTALERLKASGKYKVAALTNNFDFPEAEEAEGMGAAAVARLRPLFDYFIESRVVGLRKPDPKLFLYACEMMGIKPQEAIFLDDIGMNVRSARALGMTTLHVKMGQSKVAIRALEKLTGLVLSKKDASL